MPTNDVGRRTAPNRAERRRSRGLMVPQRQRSQQNDREQKSLKADPSATFEFQGLAVSRGSDRYNRELARDRVEAMMRYRVQSHDIELRQLRAIAMGKAALRLARRQAPRLLPEFGEWTSGCSSLGPPGRMARPRSTGAPPSPQPPLSPQCQRPRQSRLCPFSRSPRSCPRRPGWTSRPRGVCRLAPCSVFAASALTRSPRQ